MDSAACMREKHYEARGLNPTASDREDREGFARPTTSPRLIADIMPIRSAFDAFRRTGSIPKRCAHLRKRHITARKHPPFAFASVLLGTLLIGVSAGAHAKDAPAKLPKSTPTLVLLAAKSSSATVAMPAPSGSVGEPDFISPAVIERARQRIKARAYVGALRSRSAEESQGNAAADNGQQGSPHAAKLPLPKTVIARTIERIGYACGAVASATALERDEPGLYKVTCTSGQSYEARPVHGRYHFRRW